MMDTRAKDLEAVFRGVSWQKQGQFNIKTYNDSNGFTTY